MDASPTPNQQLLQFHDDFVELQSLCAFLCDAMVAITLAELVVDKRSANGLQLCAGQVKRRAEALEAQLLGLRAVYGGV